MERNVSKQQIICICKQEHREWKSETQQLFHSSILTVTMTVCSSAQITWAAQHMSFNKQWSAIWICNQLPLFETVSLFSQTLQIQQPWRCNDTANSTCCSTINEKVHQHLKTQTRQSPTWTLNPFSPIPPYNRALMHSPHERYYNSKSMFLQNT
jgi:hypothetical protein